MVRGIATFTNYFKEFKEDYVVIGGLATAMVMNDLGFTARATKDIDLVVISKNNEAFIKALLQFVQQGQYVTRQRTNNPDRHNLFRFFDSPDKEYPAQIELFAICDENSSVYSDITIIPIETPEFYSYLSAILLNTQYFQLLIEHTNEIDGLHIATALSLIPLKMHAYNNMITAGQSDSEKHLRDVIKLAAALSDEKAILQGDPKEDFDVFMQAFEDVDENRIRQVLKTSNISGLAKKDIIEVLCGTYR